VLGKARATPKRRNWSGADHRVYFGGKWWRDGDAGGLAWYDPATTEVGGFWEALSNYQVSHMATIGDARKLVLSTWRVADPLLGKSTPAEGALFTFDTTTGELSEPFAPIPDIVGTGPIVAIDNQHVFGWASHPAEAGRSILYLADIPAKTVVYTKELPFAMPVTPDSLRTEAWDFRMGPDGAIWTFLDDALTRITPLDGCIDVLGKVEPGQIAFSNGAILLGGQPQVRSVKITQSAEPQINWQAPDPIRYGTALDAAQLNATADRPGTLSYSPAAGTVLNAGTGLGITVTFTPESADSATASKRVTIDVTPVTPSVKNKGRGGTWLYLWTLPTSRTRAWSHHRKAARPKKTAETNGLTSQEHSHPRPSLRNRAHFTASAVTHFPRFTTRTILSPVFSPAARHSSA
jgi:hypothetical protein